MDTKGVGQGSASGSGGEGSPTGSMEKVGIVEGLEVAESPTTSMSTHRVGESTVDLGDGMGSTVRLTPVHLAPVQTRNHAI